jgi:glycerol-3-phosphate dehydrogenase (NAD(P)+)
VTSGAAVAVLGSGSWGTALACHLARLGRPVRLWGRNPERVAAIHSANENAVYLPGISLPSGLHVTGELEEALRGVGAVVGAVPSRSFAGVLAAAGPLAPADALWVVAVEGLEAGSARRMSEVLADALPGRRGAVLAGPSLAPEVARGLPTSVLAASEDAGSARAAQELFHGPAFRVYTNPDVVGVEIGTSVKNVVALAAGIVDGMGLGANAKGALVTRGLAEITRLGIALGGRERTFLGLAGVGDLVTTCASPLSRNRTLGEAIGRGVPVGQALRAMTQVAEGVPTTRSAIDLAGRFGVEMPIAEQVRRVLEGEAGPAEAVRALMTRPPRGEGDQG